MVDICIVGGGPAGMTAALYALRGGLTVNLVEQGMPGGQLLKTDKIDNYPGFPDGILGSNLAVNMFNQISKFENFKLINASAKGFAKENETFIVDIGSSRFEAKVLILATGGNPKNLNIPGELEFTGKGVSYCAICDGFFFKDKVIAVVGGGNTALEDAIYLSSIAKEVYLIHRRNKFRGNQILVDKLYKHNNIHLLLEKVPVEIKGNSKVDKVVLKDINSGNLNSIYINGIFIAIGQKMNSHIARKLISINDSGSIIVNEKMQTSLSGLFACGDITEKGLKQISTAVGDGALAGQMAHDYLKLSSIKLNSTNSKIKS